MGDKVLLAQVVREQREVVLLLPSWPPTSSPNVIWSVLEVGGTPYSIQLTILGGSRMITNLSGIDNPSWQERAACRNTDPAIFFIKGEGHTKKAKAICASCPVIQQCLDWTLLLEKHNRNTNAGFYAGMTANQRAKISLCKFGPCLKRVKRTNAFSFCSPEHRAEYQEAIKPKTPRVEFYKQGTLHTNGHDI